jgi:predicted metal-dependent hydrolase
MPVKVVMLPEVGKITFSQNLRSKRMKLSVGPNQKILVSFPPYVTFPEAASFAQKHISWIIGQQEKFLVKAVRQTPSFPVKTFFHTVNIQPEGEKFAVRQKKFEIIILYPHHCAQDDVLVHDHINRVMDAIYKWEAKKYLPGRIAELAATHKLAFNKITIRNNRSNWGSCSSGNNISLNMKLMKLPPHLIDFILLHELAHTQVKNHGPDFWKLLDRISEGRAKKLTSEVKKYSTQSY